VSNWTTDEQACRALKTFSAACEAADAASCTAIDTRFRRPKHLGDTDPIPKIPHSVVVAQPHVTWAGTCDVSREGKVTSCVPRQSNPAVDGIVLQHLYAGPYSAPTLDGRPFGCRCDFWFGWKSLPP
jgi:hypothetical protein